MPLWCCLLYRQRAGGVRAKTGSHHREGLDALPPRLDQQRDDARPEAPPELEVGQRGPARLWEVHVDQHLRFRV